MPSQIRSRTRLGVSRGGQKILSIKCGCNRNEVKITFLKSGFIKYSCQVLRVARRNAPLIDISSACQVHRGSQVKLWPNLNY